MWGTTVFEISKESDAELVSLNDGWPVKKQSLELILVDQRCIVGAILSVRAYKNVAVMILQKSVKNEGCTEYNEQGCIYDNNGGGMCSGLTSKLINCKRRVEQI